MPPRLDPSNDSASQTANPLTSLRPKKPRTPAPPHVHARSPAQQPRSSTTRELSGKSRRPGAGHRLGRLLSRLHALGNIERTARPARHAARIGLVSAGAGALNEALERKTDARMKRTADRPLASAASRSRRHRGRPRRAGAGAVWLALHTNLLTVSLALLTPHLRRHLHAAQTRHPHGHLHWRIPRRHGPLLGWTAARGRIEWQGVAPVRHSVCLAVPHFMAISWLYRDDYAQAGIRMLPVVQPTDVHRRRGAVLRRRHDSVSLVPWRLGMTARLTPG